MYDDDGFMIVIIFLMFILFVAGIFLIADTVDDEYTDRVEHRYNIEIVDNESDYVIYNNGDCIARKAPYDQLERMGCGEFSERLTD